MCDTLLILYSYTLHTLFIHFSYTRRPTQAKLTSGDLNKKVEFYLGFSYDGLRADSYRVRLKGFEPRNTEPIEEQKVKVIKQSPVTEKQFGRETSRIEGVGKIDLSGKIKSTDGIDKIY